jgi:uncharacterized protein RhaS with RHS repeats
LAYDAQSGFYLTPARAYDPATGRFLQEDPIAADAENLYRYGLNSPPNLSDPSGLAAAPATNNAAAVYGVGPTTHGGYGTGQPLRPSSTYNPTPSRESIIRQHVAQMKSAAVSQAAERLFAPDPWQQSVDRSRAQFEGQLDAFFSSHSGQQLTPLYDQSMQQSTLGKLLHGPTRRPGDPAPGIYYVPSGYELSAADRQAIDGGNTIVSLYPPANAALAIRRARQGEFLEAFQYFDAATVPAALAIPNAAPTRYGRRSIGLLKRDVQFHCRC